ncbi:hypothetical protein STW0522PSE72_27120 [Pseudomonas monteilii]|nr:hypothetical protein STW0522PSE72_27120 [Pseudomonas monteilii]
MLVLYRILTRSDASASIPPSTINIFENIGERYGVASGSGIKRWLGQ